MTATALPTALEPLPTPADPRPTLVARPLLTLADVLLLGQIRNEGRLSFSHDTSEIDGPRQIAWWHANKARLEPWLFDNEAGETVGYALLRQEDNSRWYSSLAVRKGHNGHDYGRQMLAWLVARWPFEVWATARADNPAACKLHDPLLWEACGAHDGLILYRTRPKIRTSKLALNLDSCGVWGGQ
jgi:hypothetical protein